MVLVWHLPTGKETMNSSMRVACKDGNEVVGFYEINSFPGCPQIAISNHAFINPKYRNKGYGKIFHAKRLREIKELGFDYILCSVKANNVFQKKILRRFGWSRFSVFPNKETGNFVELWGRSTEL